MFLIDDAKWHRKQLETPNPAAKTRTTTHSFCHTGDDNYHLLFAAHSHSLTDASHTNIKEQSAQVLASCHKKQVRALISIQC